MAAQSLGYRVVVLDPGEEGPAGSVADRHVRRDYLDPAGLAELAALAGAATTEFENVPAAALAFLARTARVCPAAESVAIAQDRIREKTFLADHGFSVAPYAVLASEDDARRVDASLCPGIVKSARMGYDGKGQIRVATQDDVAAAWTAMGGDTLRHRAARAARGRGFGRRRAHGARRRHHLARRRESPSRRHPRRVDRPGARARRAGRGSARRGDRGRGEARLPRRAVRRDVRDDAGQAHRQRDRPAARTTAATIRSTPA